MANAWNPSLIHRCIYCRSVLTEGPVMGNEVRVLAVVSGVKPYWQPFMRVAHAFTRGSGFCFAGGVVLRAHAVGLRGIRVSNGRRPSPR